MRKFLLVLGTLTLATVAVVAISIGVLAYKGIALDAESKAFVDNAVPAIAANWKREQLLTRATPELRDSIKRDQVRVVHLLAAESACTA